MSVLNQIAYFQKKQKSIEGEGGKNYGCVDYIEGTRQ